jgi:hypothetical protein
MYVFASWSWPSRARPKSCVIDLRHVAWISAVPPYFVNIELHSDFNCSPSYTLLPFGAVDSRVPATLGGACLHFVHFPIKVFRDHAEPME